MKKIALHWKIIIGMLLGVVYGLIASKLLWTDFTNDWIKPWGVIFVNLLKLIAVPLVFASLVKGVASLSDISRLSRIGAKTIAFYLMSTVVSVSIGLVLVNLIKPGSDFDKSSIDLTNKNTTEKIIDAETVSREGPLQFVVDIVPTNIINASANNSNMLQVIFFAILFGISMVMLPDPSKSINPFKFFLAKSFRANLLRSIS